MDEARLELHEPGFGGEIVIEGGQIRITGTRPQDGAEVAKDVPVDRDPELSRLVQQVLSGDDGAAVPLLAHVGELDPA